METVISQVHTFLQSDAVPKPGTYAYVATCLVVSFVASVGLGCVSFVVENITFSSLGAFERHGILERLSPDIPSTKTHFQLRTFCNFLFSSWPVLCMGLLFKDTLMATAVPCYNPLRILAFVWGAAILHDFWFFAFHTLFHKVKVLYRNIHFIHHKSYGDLNVFQTADMHLSEAFILIFGFYGLLLGSYLFKGQWDPVSYVVFVLVEASMNMEGHTGYRLPWWLYMAVTAGIGSIPGAASSTTHFIHHLDPRYNRALYLTWPDRIFGTFMGTHPRVKDLTKEQQSEYDNRIFHKAANFVCGHMAGVQKGNTHMKSS